MKKKYNTGLIIGKFYPFHQGHEFLIRTALENTAHLTVIVCQTDRYLIPAEIRTHWIKDTFPGLDVRVLNHDASLDSGSTELSRTWAQITRKFLSFTPEVVFSSEDYGEAYARFMGSRHVMVDRDRKTFPVSGTRIRSDINKYWAYLPAATREFFIKKVVVLGAESTGTTTLARDLANHYATAWVPEYGRLYYEGRMLSQEADTWTTEEFIHIAKAQNSLEDALLKKAHRLLICDTDAFATTLWHERYLGKGSEDLEKLVKKEKPLLYILTDVDIPFVQDGTRDGEAIRVGMHRRFEEKLKACGLDHILVSGNKEERLAFAVKKIDALTSSLRLSP